MDPVHMRPTGADPTHDEEVPRPITARLARMVVRVEPDLPATVLDISSRLLAETGQQYSRAAIMRGLLAIGLVTVANASSLAPLFVGAVVKQGRKSGRNWRPVAVLDRES